MPENNASSVPYSESLLVHFCRAEQLRAEALHLPALDLNRRQLCDLEGLLNRAFYPLSGFLCRADYGRVLQEMRLADGSVWPLSVCLDVSETFAAKLDSDEAVQDIQRNRATSGKRWRLKSVD